MKILNETFTIGKVTGLGSAINPSDAVSLGQMEGAIYAAHSEKTVHRTATVSSGNAIVYLTDNGDSNGNALFSDVDLDSVSIEVYGAVVGHFAGTPTISGDKTTLTVPVTKQQFALGLLQVSPVAADGSVVKVTVTGIKVSPF